MNISKSELDNYLYNLLQPNLFSDVCPNGLQVEGADVIEKLVFGVSACQALIDAAAARKAQAIVVHHGYFWQGEPTPVVGMKHKRIKSLLDNDINLWAFHLPLDCHATLGNNAELGRMLGFSHQGWLSGEGPTGLGLWGSLQVPQTGKQIRALLEQRLGRTILHVAPDERPIRRIGWCTGGAQSYIDNAADLQLDAYISGEISEQTVHSARENGLHYFAAGHHATERGGVQALAAHLSKELGLDCEFIDIDNPA